MLTEDIYGLIIGKLTRQLTDEEEKAFTHWYAQSGKNQQLFDYYSRLFVKVRQLYLPAEPDMEICLKELPIRTPFMKRRFFRYVALLFLLVTTGLGGYLWRKNDKPSLPLVQSETKGSQTIQLLLSSGKMVDLSQQETLQIREDNGVHIIHSGDTLNYSVSDCLPDRLQESEKIEYNTLIIPRGAEYFLILADGTEVWLNAGSELKYPARFTGEQREVFLKGEAYFKVTSRDRQPFLVKVQGISVKVLGTAFNVMSYPDSPCVETTLEQGRVEITAGEKNVVLQPGMQAVFTPASQKLETKYVNTSHYTSWKDRLMLFEKIRLEDLLEKLGRWYDMDIFYLNPECKEVLLTGSLVRHEEITTILHLLETMGKVKFSIQQKTIIVMTTRNK